MVLCLVACVAQISQEPFCTWRAVRSQQKGHPCPSSAVGTEMCICVPCHCTTPLPVHARQQWMPTCNASRLPICRKLGSGLDPVEVLGAAAPPVGAPRPELMVAVSYC